jgi:polyisoprenoid-binding protein YceI
MKNLTIDNAHSEIGFKVKHLMISSVKGNFSTFSGGVQENGDIFVSINTNSINTGNVDRDNHLKSADFFDSQVYPTITFTAKGTNLENTELTGELTIKGVTHPIMLEVDYNGMSVDPWGNTKHGYEINGVINRTNYGLTWNAALETGGVLVSEDVNISIDLQLMEVNVEDLVTQSPE